ncbi:hypothetical protein KSS87_013874 [Heliosperma pusillum]|nr:hypothetical protein KSS87_013874 [Heliosperma pusillum]
MPYALLLWEFMTDRSIYSLIVSNFCCVLLLFKFKKWIFKIMVFSYLIGIWKMGMYLFFVICEFGNVGLLYFI